MDKQKKEEDDSRISEVEEKIKRMLDPSIPDEPVRAEPIPEPAKPKKSITIQSVSAETNSSDTASATAPLLPNEKKSVAKKAVLKKSDKVIIPVSHHDENNSDSTPLKSPEPETPTVPIVNKITIAQNDDTTEDVAEKLDEAIAELDKQKADEEISESDSTQTQDPTDKTKQKESKSTPNQSAEDSISDPSVITDPSTDKAVEDIVAAEGDELLEIEDAVRDTDQPVKKTKKPKISFLQKLKKLWSHRGFRWASMSVLVILIIFATVNPSSRYFLLNTAGVRAKSSVMVLDQSTQLPLKNVNVTIGGASGVTNEEGQVYLQKIKLGKNTLKIDKRAFAPIEKAIVVGFGSNPLGDYSLTPTGSQYIFTITDYLSGKPIAKAEAATGDSSAFSNDSGEIKLTTDATTDGTFEVSIELDSYRTEKLTVDPNDKATKSVKLVPSKKLFFVSKRTGKYDIYSVYIDGAEEKLELAGSGYEKEDMVLVPHPKDDVIAYVSTRAGQNNSDGFLLSNLILINTQDSSTTNIVASERIQIVGWSGDYLVYVQIAAGSSANSPKRYRLMSYNNKDGVNKELASSNYFNDVLAAKDTIYFAPSSAFQTSPIGLNAIKADGSGQKTVFNQEVWNMFRTSYDDLALSVQQEWYSLGLGDESATKLNTAPSNQLSRVYVESPDGNHSIWVDIRDGKGVLINHENSTNEDTVLVSQSGLRNPVSWLNNSTVVYRVKTDQETADYAISIDGGDPVKIRDVTNSSGLDKWYY